MKITQKGRDPKTGKIRYFIDYPIWDALKRRGTHLHRVALGSRELAIKIAEIEALNGSSLKAPLFYDCVKNTLKCNDGAGMKSVYDIIGKELGKYRVDNNFCARYNDFIEKLKMSGKAVNTISNYKGCIRHVLKKAWSDRLINEIPVRDFGIKHEFRSRIWTDEEKLRIYNNLNPEKNLYWLVYFAERNPIRKMDLVNLKRENLVLVGPHPPYISYQPAKTARSKPKRCILFNLDEAILARFADIQKRFPDCPFLFPEVMINKRQGTEQWGFQGNPKKAFKNVCEKAGVFDFHFHDLKHVAITYMLKNGVSRDALKKRGIQLSDKSIDVYDETDAFDTLPHSTYIAHEGGQRVCAS
jgi:integrase